MNTVLKKLVAGIAGVTVLSVQFFGLVLPVNAAVSNWYKGANVFPTSVADFNSDAFRQSLRDLKATGANYVALVVPYYQTDINSTDVQNGWNTPSDTSLAAGIDFAHSIGLAVALKVHIEPYTGDWRAKINPADRTTWFQKYGNNLVHLGQIGQAHNAEMFIMGTEMVSMTSTAINGTNTQNWLDMIARVRQVYSGTLTYDANSTNNNDNPFENEKKTVGFWSALDVVGLSVYYNLNTNDNSVAALEGQWDYWNNSDLMQFANTVDKPLVFTEIGFRSVDNAHKAPWDSGTGGAYNATEQANAYQALLDYWNKYNYVQGVFWWDWLSNPNGGGQGDISYTPQHKPAQDIMKQWFTTPSAPPAKTTYQVSGSISPTQPSAGAMATLSATVGVTGSALQNGLVDIEVYDVAANKRIFQHFYEGETIAAGTQKTYSTSWMPTASGQYRMAIGVFTTGWAQGLYWNNNSVDISVGSGSGGGMTPPPTTGPFSTNVWWPGNNAHVSGVQPFKAMVEGLDVSQYAMYWQVDGGALVPMGDNSSGYPHKESLVDLTSWTWKAQGPYTVTFVSKDKSGAIISQKSVQILVP